MKRVIFNILAFTIIVSSLNSCGYNGGVERQEAVVAAWGQVENVYQRRADLIQILIGKYKHHIAGEQGCALSKFRMNSGHASSQRCFVHDIVVYQSKIVKQARYE